MEKTDLVEGLLEAITEKIAGKIIQHIKENSLCVSIEKEEIDDVYLSREEVLQLCNIKSYSTLWSWRKSGLLSPNARAGRKVLYSKKEVIDFLEGRKGGCDD